MNHWVARFYTTVCTVRYQQTLPELVAGRERPHLTLAELSKLMKWKLAVSWLGHLFIPAGSCIYLALALAYPSFHKQCIRCI